MASPWHFNQGPPTTPADVITYPMLEMVVTTQMADLPSPYHNKSGFVTASTRIVADETLRAIHYRRRDPNEYDCCARKTREPLKLYDRVPTQHHPVTADHVVACIKVKDELRTTQPASTTQRTQFVSSSETPATFPGADFVIPSFEVDDQQAIIIFDPVAAEFPTGGSSSPPVLDRVSRGLLGYIDKRRKRWDYKG